MCVYSNRQISSQRLRDSFAALFETTCPQLIQTRWNFLYFTLSWLLERQAALEHLAMDIDNIVGCKELSASEIDMLKKLAHNGTWAKRFWLVAALCKSLCDWGIRVSKFFHACPCHPKSNTPSDPSQAQAYKKERLSCQLKGRQGVWMAWGMWETFLEQLDVVVPGPESATLVQQLQQLDEQEPNSEANMDEAGGQSNNEFCQRMLVDFQSCKAAMAFRGTQAWAFWSSLAWAILKIAGVFWGVSEKDCRAAAADLLGCYDKSEAKSSLGVPCSVLFGRGGAHRLDLDNWISGHQMSLGLMRELFFYSLSLITMQRLEAKHRYIAIQVGRGRASSPAATMAELRRKANKDLEQADFRKLFPELMDSFDLLVPGNWDSFGDLLRMVYGFGCHQMHPNIASEQDQMRIHCEAIANAKASCDRQVPPLLREHMVTCLKHKKCYALPLESGPANSFRVFQMVSHNPAQRSYIQRTSALSVDEALALPRMEFIDCFFGFGWYISSRLTQRPTADFFLFVSTCFPAWLSFLEQ